MQEASKSPSAAAKRQKSVCDASNDNFFFFCNNQHTHAFHRRPMISSLFVSSYTQRSGRFPKTHTYLLYSMIVPSSIIRSIRLNISFRPCIAFICCVYCVLEGNGWLISQLTASTIDDVVKNDNDDDDDNARCVLCCLSNRTKKCEAETIVGGGDGGLC